jgi:hypothetical protein
MVPADAQEQEAEFSVDVGDSDHAVIDCMHASLQAATGKVVTFCHIALTANSRLFSKRPEHHYSQ